MIFCVCLHQYCHPIGIFLQVMEVSTILSVCANGKAKLFPQRDIAMSFMWIPL